MHENDNVAYKNFAVFYRTNAQSRVFEDAFRIERISYNIVGTLKFYERKEIKDIISYLRVIVNPNDNLSLKRIINVPHRNIGETTVKMLEEYAAKNNISLWETLQQSNKIDIMPKTARNVEEFKNLINHFRQLKEQSNGIDLTNAVINESGYLDDLKLEDSIQSKERIGNLMEFISAIQEYSETTNKTDIEEFLASITLMSEIDTFDKTSNADNVTLMTLHLAKGLEFDTVFVTGLEEGLFPIASSLMEDNIDEERRLCYVGMTRARNNLFLTYAQARRLFGQIRFNAPSRFIQEAQLNTEMKSINKIADTPRHHSAGHPKTGFRRGQKVKHPEFGSGRIVNISGKEEEMKVTVLFENGNMKKLLVKYANLNSN